MPVPTLDFVSALTAAEEAARIAGALLRTHFTQPLNITRKSAIEVVTEADGAAEKAILDHLLPRYPDHHFIGEEGGGVGRPRKTAKYRWHIDPLDGTTNFSRRIPHFAVSIALADSRNRPLVGVVYDPIREECFTALRGGWARLNGVVIRVSDTPTLGEAVLTSGFPYDRRRNPDNNTEEWSQFVTRTAELRRLGSAALDLCWTACGRLDGFWEPRLKTWDIMAGLLIVTEAGGKVTNYRGGTENVYNGREVVATNSRIHEQVLEVIILGAAAPRPKGRS
jgi:myo-inositol-1(or 4)-monophosphatase